MEEVGLGRAFYCRDGRIGVSIGGLCDDGEEGSVEL